MKATTHFNSIDELKSAYKNGLSVSDYFNTLLENAKTYADHNIWIYQLSVAELSPYLDALNPADIDELPLWGVPFAIKDNIDLGGIPTTAACEAFAYTPDSDAVVVQQLIKAGAIPIGKTNLDQFATGLNGTRSPYGACRHAFLPDTISGGSSSGSAVAVACRLAMFSLGTDTAGSGRVPAGFHGLVGVKPTRGLLSSTGLVPACRSLDCISIMAHNVADAHTVLAVAEGYDANDGYSRHNPYHNHHSRFGYRSGRVTLGVLAPKDLRFFGDEGYADAYQTWLEQLADMPNVALKTIDYRPFDETAKLLYEGPWVSERYLACQPLIDEQPDAIHPVVREIIAGGRDLLAKDLFAAQYRLQALKQTCDAALAQVDALMLPTAGRLFSIKAMLEAPIQHNSELGYYTNFVNLLDYSALAMPAGVTTDERPFGVTLIGQAFCDRDLLNIANTLTSDDSLTPQPRSAMIDVAVCGAHLSDMPLNWQLQACGATLKAQTRSADSYRLYALDNLRPALVQASDGRAIDVEVWTMPTAAFGAFVAGIPAPLGMGKITLADGSQCCSFICEANAITPAHKDISHFGGWKAYKTNT